MSRQSHHSSFKSATQQSSYQNRGSGSNGTMSRGTSSRTATLVKTDHTATLNRVSNGDRLGTLVKIDRNGGHQDGTLGRPVSGSGMLTSSHCDDMNGYYGENVQLQQTLADEYVDYNNGGDALVNNYDDTLSDHNSGRFLLTRESSSRNGTLGCGGGGGSTLQRNRRTLASPAELWLV